MIESGPFTVKFLKREISTFDQISFRTFFLPIFLGKDVELSYEKAKEFALGEDYDQHALGVRSLMRQHSGRVETWLLFINLILDRDVENISPETIYYLAHIPGHPDIFYHSGSMPSAAIKESTSISLARLTKEDVIKLLSYVDENGISRGSLGQNVESIISILPNKIGLLHSIIEDTSASQEARAWASFLYAYYMGEDAPSELKELAAKYPDIEIISDLIEQIEHEGYIYLY